MCRLRNSPVLTGIAGGVVGFLAGCFAGGVIAAVVAFSIHPLPEPGHGPDPIGAVLALIILCINLFWVVAVSLGVGAVGAIGGAVYATARRSRRAANTEAADEIAALKARVAELEGRRS
jgi:hypothetical protein